MLQAYTSVLLSALALLARRAEASPSRIEYNAELAGQSAVAAPIALTRVGWTVTADSFQTGNEAVNIFDNNPGTFWHTEYNPTVAPLPHYLTIDMRNSYAVNGITYLPRQDGLDNGDWGQHTIQLSVDGVNWVSVASGTYSNDNTLKQTNFASTPARFLRISIQSEAQGQNYQWSSCAELNVLSGPDPTLPRDNWLVTVDSEEPAPQYHSGTEAVDGAVNTFWHTQYDGGSVPGFPHTFTIDQTQAITVSGLTYLPRPISTGPNGRIGQYIIEQSNDASTWLEVTNGTWIDSATLKVAEFAPITARYFRLVSLTEAGNRGPWTSAAEINLLDGSRQITDFLVTVDSQETVEANNTGPHALDSDLSTFWHTEWSQSPVPGFPHSFVIDMQSSFYVSALTYTPRQDGNQNGNIGNHSISVSTDAVNWIEVATGSFYDDQEAKLVNFEESFARYVQLTSLSEAGDRGPWTSAAEITLTFSSGTVKPSASSGQWGLTIDFPIVPVAAVLLENGEVLTWSANVANNFDGSGVTLTSSYNINTGVVSERTVTETNHDMFCPGLSVDFTGRPVVSGGYDDEPTSIYDPVADEWIAAADLQIGRGYQGQVTISDGRTFTIGGSWSGAQGGKNGEIYDPTTNTWTLLPGCPVAPMLTNDGQGVYRADNHGWFFGWKTGCVFQAGPSAAMNWYGTVGNGSQASAGPRGDDTDAMNGNAVMYDAVNGKILTLGGATSYQSSSPTANANIITIGDPGTIANVVAINPMHFARSFGNAVVLPDGSVFIVGGQEYAIPFTDDQAVLYPELWSPITNEFTVLAPMVNPRTYHSIALLLPDATILSGGGGLCGNCSVNHFDAEIFTPPYLFNSDGSLATRPQISSVSATTFPVGGTIVATTNTAVTAFSMIRYGSSTHTVDTDQRRIALTPSASGLTYTMDIPNDPGITIPGYWMLFAIDSAGVPSLAATLLITLS